MIEAISEACARPRNKFGRLVLTEADREALRTARRERGMRVKVLARMLGVSPSLFGKWQMGERCPTSDQLVRWWRAVSAPD